MKLHSEIQEQKYKTTQLQTRQNTQSAGKAREREQKKTHNKQNNT